MELLDDLGVSYELELGDTFRHEELSDYVPAFLTKRLAGMLAPA
jgi:hypothetical protein